MCSEQVNRPTFDVLNKVRKATFKYPNVSQLRDSDSVASGTHPAGGFGEPPAANRCFPA